MKLSHLAVAVSIAFASAASVAKTESLGTLTDAGATFGNSFLLWGGFTDYYSFSLGSGTEALGTTVSYDSLWQDISISSVTLQSQTGSSWSDWGSSAKDTSPNQFSFSGLGAGLYRLVVSGDVGFQIDLRDPLSPASYQGVIKSVASPAPEPAALGMALVGLMGVSFAVMRRRRG
jgi:hypothetical protein